MADFPPLYPCSEAEARRLGEHHEWERSFHGVIRDECLPDWAREQLEKLKNGQALEPPEDHSGGINMTM